MTDPSPEALSRQCPIPRLANTDATSFQLFDAALRQLEFFVCSIRFPYVEREPNEKRDLRRVRRQRRSIDPETDSPEPRKTSSNALVSVGTDCEKYVPDAVTVLTTKPSSRLGSFAPDSWAHATADARSTKAVDRHTGRRNGNILNGSCGKAQGQPSSGNSRSAGKLRQPVRGALSAGKLPRNHLRGLAFQHELRLGVQKSASFRTLSGISASIRYNEPTGLGLVHNPDVRWRGRQRRAPPRRWDARANADLDIGVRRERAVFRREP